MTSRWLVSVAQERGFDITWRTLSLSLLNEDAPVPEAFDTPEFRAETDLGAQALRVVQAALARGDNEAAGRFYAEWGVRFHEAGREPTPELLQEVAEAAGVTDMLAEADKPELDAPIAASLEEAMALAGPDVGSPVLHVGGSARGSFGPIVSPPPTGEDVGALWDAVVALQNIGSFFELKRGRTDPPQFTP